MAMSELNTFASLGPTLLARKGGAKPAMRSHAALTDATQLVQADIDDFDDLGWNDMGDEGQEDESLGSEHYQAEIVTLKPASPKDHPEDRPENHRADQAIANDDARGEPRKKRKGSNGGNSGQNGHRAAFTLRLDADRHLKLKLASTVMNRSAQQLVTEALDQFLAETPEINALAAQVKRD